MSVISVPPAGLAPSRPALPRAGRALWLEFKRNAVPYVLPLLAAVFYFNAIRTADGYPPVWAVRASVIDNDMVFEFGAFAAGLAAWAGSREGRRKTADLVATTPRAVWARQSVALAGTLGWMLLAFLAGVALAARRALRSPLAPAAAIGALVTYLAHSPLDWDWQMPAVTLVAIVLAGAVLAAAGDADRGAAEPQSSSAMRGASRRKIQTANAQTPT